MAAPAKPMRFDELPGEAQSDAPPKFDELPGEAQDDSHPIATAALNFANQASLVGVPNVLAGVDVVRGALRGDAMPASERFQRAHDEYAQHMNNLNEANPTAATAGSLATLALANPETVAQAAIAPMAQAGLSSDELAHGDVAGALKQASIGGALGLGTAAAGEAVSSGFGKLKDVASSGLRAAEADAGEQAAMAAQKAVRSARGALGGEANAALHAFDEAQKILQDPIATASQKLKAAQFINSPKGQALQRRAWQNVLDQFPGRMGQMELAEQAMQEAVAKNSPQAIEAAAAEKLASPIKKSILPRIGKYAARTAMPVAGGFIGHEVGEQTDSPILGTTAGIAAGALGSAALGAPGTAFANMTRNPGVRKLAGTVVGNLASSSASASRFAGQAMPKLPALQKLLSRPEKLGPFAGPLMNAKTPHEQATAAYVLQSQNPGFRKLLEETEQEPDDSEP